MFTAGINSPFTLSLSFANKVICLLEPDPTCKYSSFIWVFLLRCMGQPFWAVESCSHLIFFLWSTCTLAAQLKSPQIFQPVESHSVPWSVQMTSYIQKVHKGISQWLINIQTEKFILSALQFIWSFPAKDIWLTRLTMFFWVTVMIITPYLSGNQFLIGALHSI